MSIGSGREAGTIRLQGRDWNRRLRAPAGACHPHDDGPASLNHLCFINRMRADGNLSSTANGHTGYWRGLPGGLRR
jgi:hypothetical protein